MQHCPALAALALATALPLATFPLTALGDDATPRGGAWPQLKVGRVAAVLLGTAIDLGAPVVEDVPRAGQLDADRAPHPPGTRAGVALRSSVETWSGLIAAARAGRFRGIAVEGRSRGPLDGADVLRSEAFAVGLISHDAITRGDRLAVTLSSPLRRAAGSARLLTPFGIADADDTAFETRRIGLTATRRELSLGVEHVMPLWKSSSLSWLLTRRQNANHVAGEHDTLAGAVYRTSF